MMKKEEREKVIQALTKVRKRVPWLALKVAPIYAILNWKWHDLGVPTDRDIMECLWKIVDDLIADFRDAHGTHPTAIRTGGLSVEWSMDEGGCVGAGIDFSVSESSED